MQRLIGENLHGGDINNIRVLSYQNKAPAPPEGYQNPLRVVYSQAKTPAGVKSSSRYIPQAPDRILDAPEILDDYCKWNTIFQHWSLVIFWDSLQKESWNFSFKFCKICWCVFIFMLNLISNFEFLSVSIFFQVVNCRSKILFKIINQNSNFQNWFCH